MAVSLVELWLAPLTPDQDERPRHGIETRHLDERSTVPSADADLVARIRASDEEAFAALVHAYGDRLFRFASRELQSRHTAEEVVQELFATLWARRAQFVVEYSLQVYLFQSIRHRISNMRRASRVADRANIRLSEGDASVTPTMSPSPDTVVGEAELRGALERALGKLPDRPREVFQLSREQHLTFREIAAVLGLSQRTVEHHMARAIAALREALADWL